MTQKIGPWRTRIVAVGLASAGMLALLGAGPAANAAPCPPIGVAQNCQNPDGGQCMVWVGASLKGACIN
jgi:hypothetical protein